MKMHRNHIHTAHADANEREETFRPEGVRL